MPMADQFREPLIRAAVEIMDEMKRNPPPDYRALASSLAKALREFLRIEGGGGCAPGVEGHDQPCGCDLAAATEQGRAALAAYDAAYTEGR